METAEKNIIKKFSRQTYLEKVFPYLKEEKTQTFLTLAMTFAAITIFGFFAITPTLSTIAQLQKQLEDAKSANQQLQTKITNLGILNNKYAQLGDDITLLSNALPDTPQAPRLLAQVNALAIENTVHIITMTTDPFTITILQTNKQKISPIIFSLLATGKKENILAFISALGNFNRIITIESLTIHLDTNNTSLTLSGKAYVNN